MLPLLTADDEVLVDPRAYRRQPPRVGEVVVAQHPTQANLRIIKRITQVEDDGHLQLIGDNPDPAQNSASRVPRQLILGRVTSRFG